MKTKLLIWVALAISFNAFGQNEPPKLPIDDTTKKITYSEVVTVDSTLTKDELYSRGREWLAKTYNSSKDVIQMDDKESGKIIGKALMPVSRITPLGDTPSGTINYSISLYLKKGKYKYEITDFYFTGDEGMGWVGIACEYMIENEKTNIKKSNSTTS